MTSYLTKLEKYLQFLEFCLSLSLEQKRTRSNKITDDQTAALIDHILINSPNIVSQTGFIDFGPSDQDLIHYTRKTSLPKSSKHNEICLLDEKVLRPKIFGKSKRYCFGGKWCLLRFYI